MSLIFGVTIYKYERYHRKGFEEETNVQLQILNRHLNPRSGYSELIFNSCCILYYSYLYLD